jgi:hypothetical protein
LLNGNQKISCFSHPCQYSIGELFDETLYCLDAQNIHKIKELVSFPIKQTETITEINGILLNKKTGLIKSNGFIFEIDSEFIPQDISSNDFISFTCSKLYTI